MSNTVNVIHIKASPEEAAENLLDTLKGELQRKGDVLCSAWTELHTLLSQPGVVTVEDPTVLTTLQEKGSLLSTTWNELYNLIAAYQTELSSRESQVVTAWSQIQNKEHVVIELKQKIARLEEEVRKKNESMSTTQATITALLSQQKEYDNVYGGKEEKIQELQSKLEENETVLSKLTLENMDLTAKVEELENQVQNLDPNRKKLEDTLEKYKTEILRLTEENSSLTEKLKVAVKSPEPVKVTAQVMSENGIKEVKIPIVTASQVMKPASASQVVMKPASQVVMKPASQVVVKPASQVVKPASPVVKTVEAKKVLHVVRSVIKADEVEQSANGGQGDAPVKKTTEKPQQEKEKEKDQQQAAEKTQSSTSLESVETNTRKTRSTTNTNPAIATISPVITPAPETATPRTSGRRRKIEAAPKPTEQTSETSTSKTVQEEPSPMRSKRGRIIKTKTWTDYYAGYGHSMDKNLEPIDPFSFLAIQPGHEKTGSQDTCINVVEGSNENTARNTVPGFKNIDEKPILDETDHETIGGEVVENLEHGNNSPSSDDVKSNGNKCTECTCKFLSLRSLRMHMIRAHSKVKSQTLADGRAKRMIGRNKKTRGQRKKGVKDTKGVRVKKSVSDCTCEECGQRFPGHFHLLGHLKRSHNMENPHRCGYCGQCYTSKEALKTHHLEHSSVKPFKCDDCDACFVKRSQLVRHARSHTGERPFVCEICQRTFADAYLLTVHKRYHDEKKPYICETCGISFRRNYDIKRHILTHTGERRYHCDECGKYFQRLEHLKLHQRTHSGEKPYTCEECTRSFSQPGDLKKHMMTHTGVRPFSCECGKSYTTKGAYQKHLESRKCNLARPEIGPRGISQAQSLLETVPESSVISQNQVNTETPPQNMATSGHVQVLNYRAENVINEPQVENVSVNTCNLSDIQNIISSLAHGDLGNQPLTVIQTDPGFGSQVAFRIVDGNIAMVPLSEISPDEAAASQVIQLETQSGLQETDSQSQSRDDSLLAQLQGAVATASNTAVAPGDEVVHVFLEQQPS